MLFIYKITETTCEKMACQRDKVCYVHRRWNSREFILPPTAKICNVMLNDLRNAGFTVNFKKSKLTPSRREVWLGFIVDTEKMMLFVPKEKTEKLLEKIEKCLEGELTTARTISQIAGHLSSMSIAVGPLTRLFTKNMHVFIESSYSWSSLRPISFNLRTELLFWRSNLSRCNGLSMTINTQVNKVVYSDASDIGYGGYIVHALDKIIAKGQFDPEEKGTSSTYRELLAVKHILESFKSHLKSQRVQWFSDNVNVTRIINSGSTRNHLQSLAVDIYNICL